MIVVWLLAMLSYPFLAQTGVSMESAIPLWAQLGVAAVFLMIAGFVFVQARKAVTTLHANNKELALAIGDMKEKIAEQKIAEHVGREKMLIDFDDRRAKDLQEFTERVQEIKRNHIDEMMRNRDILSGVESDIRALLTNQLAANTAVLVEVKEIIENHTDVIDGNRADIVQLGRDLKKQIEHLPTAINAPILERFDALDQLLSGIDHGISEASREVRSLRAMVDVFSDRKEST